MFNCAGGTLLLAPPPSFGTNGALRTWFNPAFFTTSSGVVNTFYDILQPGNQPAGQYWKGTVVAPTVNPTIQNTLNGRTGLVISCPATLTAGSNTNDPCNYWNRGVLDPSPAITQNFTFFVVGSTTKTINIFSNVGSGGYVSTSYLHNMIVMPYHRDTNNGVGLSIGTNGAVVIAHGSGFFPPGCNYTISLGTTPHIFAVRVTSNAPSIFIDGLTQTRVGVAFTQGVSYAGAAVSCPFYGSFNGTIGEYLIYDKALSNNDLLTVFRHLAGRYRITLV